MTSNDSTILIDQCLNQSSSERIPLAADEKRYRDPQTDILLRDSLEWEVFIKSLPSELRESHGREDGKIIRARRRGGHQGN